MSDLKETECKRALTDWVRAGFGLQFWARADLWLLYKDLTQSN